MPHVIHAVVQEDEFRHVLLNEFEILISSEVIDVFDRARDKVVDADDFVTSQNQEVGQVRTKKTRRARHNAYRLMEF